VTTIQPDLHLSATAAQWTTAYALSHGGTLAGMLVTGAGFGLAMSPLNTDALNRAPAEIRGEASGVVQTFRELRLGAGVMAVAFVIGRAFMPGGKQTDVE
jgi:hypothetical protein